jgi:hypothetical protein
MVVPVALPAPSLTIGTSISCIDRDWDKVCNYKGFQQTLSERF